MRISNEKRLIIYFFYDKAGVVDDYVRVMLEDLRKNSDEIHVVCNGVLKAEGKQILEGLADKVIVRDNKGFDVWAYKTALEEVGYENLKNYGEIVLMNFTIMGPVYPFKEMFDSMDSRDLDFWGLTVFHEVPYDPFGTIKFNYIPLHLQSHFIAIRTPMLESKEFIDYWKNMQMITCYEEAVGCHEAIFTKTFADLGFKWDVYVDTRDEASDCYCPMIMKPRYIIQEKRCPVFKRRNFFHDYRDILNQTTGEPAYELFNYIKNNTDYDVNLIWDNILRVQNQADIKRNMHLTYILPDDIAYNTNSSAEGKIALVLHSYFVDLIPYCYNYALSMPECADVYITTDTNEKREEIEKVFNNGPWNKVEVILIENRGRDVSALLVGTKDFIFDYDYVCFMHDKKVAQLDLGVKGESFSYKCFENMLKSKEYVLNIIDKFVREPKLGMLMPPPPNFAEYYPTMGAVDWGINFEPTQKLIKELHLSVAIDKEKEPIAPLGTMFWFRTDALRRLFEYDWEYDEFPQEPNKTDGTLLHAIERIYPYVVQHEGYYPAWVMNDKYASIEVDNQYFMLRELNKSLFKVVMPNTHLETLINLEKLQSKEVWGEAKLAQLFVKGEDGYSEERSIKIRNKFEDDYFEYKNLQKYGMVDELRWDPTERGGIELGIMNIEVHAANGEVYYYGIDDMKSNGIRVDNSLVYISGDPQIIIKLKSKVQINKIIIMAHMAEISKETEIKLKKALRLKFR